MSIQSSQFMYMVIRISLGQHLTYMQLAVALDQEGVVLPPPLVLMDTVRCAVGFATVPHPPESQVSSQAYANYARDHLQMSLLFQSWVSYSFLYVVVCYGVCSLIQVLMWLPFSPMGASPLGFTPPQPFRVYPLQACVLVCCLWHGSTE